jgi:CBS domain-containing protein
MATGIRVRDAMVSRVVTTKASENILECSKLMTKEDVGSIIICEGNKPVGIITREDIINKVTTKDLQASKILIKDIMTKEIISVTPDADIADAAKLMAKYGYERLPVVSMGKLVGIISTREVAKVAPAAIEILRERLLVESPQAIIEEFNEGECELCGNYSESLHNINDRWVCDSCKEEAREL